MILYGISYSAWTLRARWALNFCQVDHEYREFIPMVTEPLLKLKVGGGGGKLTVPLLLDGTSVFRDSKEIARHADEIGRPPHSLFADGDEVVDTWVATADELSEGGRVISTFRVLEDKRAVRENVPGFIPRPLRPLATPMVGLGAKHLQRKYGYGPEDHEDALRTMRSSLERVANRLVGRDYLGEGFGFSDMAVISALQFVKPADGWAKLGPASVEAWTQAELVADFEDLLRWRDRVLQDHPPR